MWPYLEDVREHVAVIKSEVAEIERNLDDKLTEIAGGARLSLWVGLPPWGQKEKPGSRGGGPGLLVRSCVIDVLGCRRSVSNSRPHPSPIHQTTSRLGMILKMASLVKRSRSISRNTN